VIGITGTDEKTKVEEKVFADKIIVATGGKSYPVTGSTGDGYKIAKELGHTVTDLKPSLVPLKCDEQKSKKICQDLQGLSLRNVSIKIKHEAKIIYEDFGEMLFTHFGLSGPIILSSSSILIRYKNIHNLMKENKIKIVIDLKPSLTEIQLDSRILRDFNEIKNKQFKNSLEKLLPQKMITPIIVLTGINPEKRVNEITKEERAKLVKIIKNMELNISGFRPIEEAIITSGGVNIKEINPKTMESKIINGVFFAGEVIDLDAYTGGFNLQIAWSTGYVAGNKTI
jgi:predicted Rossmann fold flavoprotein